jgi:hypothetical protein
MHPEMEIAAEFWLYVNERGHGDAADAYPKPPALMEELVRQYWIALESKDEEKLRSYLVRVTWESDEPWVLLRPEQDADVYHLPPTGFPTLQEALYDYLLASVGEHLIANDYDLWLRAVAHILADAARDPSRMVIRVRPREDELSDRNAVNNTMIISDDWGVLRRETFDFARRNYERHG